jgi:hypothetical protein
MYQGHTFLEKTSSYGYLHFKGLFCVHVTAFVVLSVYLGLLLETSRFYLPSRHTCCNLLPLLLLLVAFITIKTA